MTSGKCGITWRRNCAAEIAVGFAMAFLAALVVVRPFLRFVSRSGFAPFAWYRILAGLALLGGGGGGLAVGRSVRRGDVR